MSCPMDCRDELMKNIIISGRLAKLPGVAERLKKELTYLHLPFSLKLFCIIMVNLYLF